MAKIPGWKIVKALGAGGQGSVDLVTRESDPDGPQFALKRLKSTDKEGQPYRRFCREIDALKTLDHPAIIKLIEHSAPESDSPHFYVMEYVEGACSLAKVLGNRNPFKGDERKAIRMFLEILSGLEACEAKNVVHRDLSPANILVLPDEHIKIIDFGLCDIESGERVTLVDENLGTVNYRAPECAPHSSYKISIATDLYSAAKILWSAITDRIVFEREEVVFKTLSMSQYFADFPNRWHLQRVFENTIRENPSKRWQGGTQARVATERLCSLIEQRTWPVELLTKRCPTCRWGSLVDPDDAFPQGGGYELFAQSQPQGVIKKVCNHCGHCFLIAHNVWKQTVDASQNLS
jgi:serine/threonine protein kinase